MLEIPVSWVITILAGLAAASLIMAPRLPGPAKAFLCAGLLGQAVIGLFLGLRFSFGVDVVHQIQPMLAILTAATLYLGFAAMTIDAPYPWARVALIHGGALALSIVAMLASGLVLADLLVPGVTLAYLILLVRHARRPSEEFIHATPGDLRILRAGLLITILFFLVFILIDATIFAALLMAGPDILRPLVTWAVQIVTGLVLIVALVGVPLILFRSDPAPDPGAKSVADADDADRQLLARFDAMLKDSRLFTDNALTLARAARRLGVPARALSQAVNRAGQANLSRYVNGYRIRYAQELLKTTDLPVTEVMLEVGFLSKSTFNTEFRRITGTTPTNYRTQR